MRIILATVLVVVFGASAFAEKALPEWVRVTESAAWLPRDSAGEMAYGGRLWLLGGWYQSYEAPPRDVWSSPDGKEWTRVVEAAPWIHSDLPMNLTFGDSMWIM
ncbi:MAG TPA: galactose oxidase, partial [Candidatus Hydrogenedentes bacterium]|nr:galactose oxidase [Candidatus Hydrogenedentota bacterium]